MVTEQAGAGVLLVCLRLPRPGSPSQAGLQPSTEQDVGQAGKLPCARPPACRT